MNYEWIVLIFFWSKIVYRNESRNHSPRQILNTTPPGQQTTWWPRWPREAWKATSPVPSKNDRNSHPAPHQFPGSWNHVETHVRKQWIPLQTQQVDELNGWVRDEIHCEIHCRLWFWNIKVLTLARSSSLRAPVTCAGFRLGRGFCGCCESWLTPYCFPRNCRVKRMARVVAQLPCKKLQYAVHISQYTHSRLHYREHWNVIQDMWWHVTLCQCIDFIRSDLQVSRWASRSHFESSKSTT